MRRISRRSVMLGGVSAAALAVAFPLRSAVEKSITVAQFRNLSLRVTGAGLAAKLLDGFMSMGTRSRSGRPHHERGDERSSGQRHRCRLVFGRLPDGCWARGI